MVNAKTESIKVQIVFSNFLFLRRGDEGEK